MALYQYGFFPLKKQNKLHTNYTSSISDLTIYLSMMNEWMFKDTPARKTDQLLGVRTR